MLRLTLLLSGCLLFLPSSESNPTSVQPTETESTLLGRGACRGQGWRDGKWPIRWGMATLDECAQFCSSADGCTAFDIARERRGKYDCWLFGHQDVRPDITISGDCYILGPQLGEYELEAGPFNDWHYVTISQEDGVYKWTNRAGRTWSLYPSGPNSLRVGEDCPYFRSGYTTAHFNKKGIEGPWKEFYKQLGPGPQLGEFELEAGPFNNWHYVTISQNPKNGVYKWTNRAGRTWSLYRSGPNSLRVGEDCPYFKSGYTTAYFNKKGIEGPWKEFYKQLGPGPQLGEYELEAGPFNNWHYVTISQNPKNGVYKWTNRAGRTWSLYRSGPNSLRVGEDCPYFKSGYTTAYFNKQGIEGPWKEFYAKH